MLDINRVAEILSASPTTVRRLLREGDIPSFRVGKLWRIKPEDLETYMQTTSNPNLNESEIRNEQH
jgi:excisionase family DNA binding protein